MVAIAYPVRREPVLSAVTTRGSIVALTFCTVLALMLSLAESIHSNQPAGAVTLATKAIAAVPGLTLTSATIDSATDVDSALITTNNGVTVDAPRDPAAGVSLTTSTGNAVTIGLPTIGLPGSFEAHQEVTSENGVIIYPDALPGASVAVQANADGLTRFLTVITDADAPSDYRFPVNLAGGSLIPQEDGSVAMLKADGDFLGSIAPPWGLDANQLPVPARFIVKENTLVLHVDHQTAVYPVVADPAVTLDCGFVTCSAYLSRSATRSIGHFLSRYQTSSATAIAGAALTACASTGAGAVVAAICGAVGATYGSFLIDQFLEASKKNRCIRFRYGRLPVPPGFTGPLLIYVDNSKYCKNR